MKSRPYKLGDKLFRYDFDSSTVEYILKAEPVEIEAEREWLESMTGHSTASEPTGTWCSTPFA